MYELCLSQYSALSLKNIKILAMKISFISAGYALIEFLVKMSPNPQRAINNHL